MKLRLLLTFIVSITLVFNLMCQPILNKCIHSDGKLYCPDKQDKSIVYFAPGELLLEKNEKGKPHMKLLFQRYLGQSLNGMQGLVHQKSILQFKIGQNPVNDHNKEQIKLLFPFLETLLPLPEVKFKLRMVYIPIDQEKTFTIGMSSVDSSSLWKEKYITMMLSPNDAQLLENQLRKGNTQLSIEVEVISSGVILLNEETDNNKKSKNDTLICKEVLKYVTSNYPINIAIEKSEAEDVISKVDINAQKIPLEYAQLEVRCYAFQDHKNANLLNRKIEIQTEGIQASGVVKASVSFSRKNSDEVVRSVRFNQIINASKPFRYRIIDIHKDVSQPFKSDWITCNDWFKVIDISNFEF